MKVRKPRRRLGCPIAIIVTVALIVGISYRYVDFPFASAELRHEWERAKKNGIALESQSLRPNPPIDPSQNAAFDLLPITVKVEKALNADKTPLPPARTPVLEANFARYQQSYNAVKPFMGEIEKALQKPKYYVERDYDLSLEILLPEFAKMKTIAKAFAHSAQLKARNGDAGGAAKDVNLGIRLSNMIAQDETLIAFLVAQAVYSIEMSHVVKVCHELEGNEAAIRKIRQEVVEPSVYPSDFPHAMRLEMVMGLYMLRNADRYGGIWKMTRSIASLSNGNSDNTMINKKAPIVRTGFPRGVVAKAFAAQSLRYWNDVLESKEWKSKDWAKVATFMDHKADNESFGKTHKLSHLANDVLMPVFAQAGLTITKAEAKKRVVRSLLLVMEYKARTGRYPGSLKEAGADTDDPFAKGLKLRYKTDGKTAKVWSVGMDGKDDGGDPEKSGDIVVINPPVK